MAQRNALSGARREFLDQWGALGSAWGVNRTMSRIHALLMISPAPLNTDEIMTELQISRGSAHGNLKELVSWGLVRPVLLRGERKEHFEGEKDVWKVVRLIARQRRQKEVEPAVEVLDRCLDRTKGLKDAEARAFRGQLQALRKFAGLAERVMRRLGDKFESAAMPWILRFLK